MSENLKAQCGDEQMREILVTADADTMAGMAAIDAALGTFPNDARLHFLKGSMLIGEKRFIAAHSALAKAVALAPDFHLARFQLGFFELTSGEAETALGTWQPLHALPEGNYLKVFVNGLEHLVADRFEDCTQTLRRGMALNSDNLPLNADMQLIIDRCEEILGTGGTDGAADAGAVSATSFLLDTARKTKR